MRRKFYVSLNDYTIEALNKSTMHKRESNFSRTIEYYTLLGLSIDNRVELAMPVILQDLKETMERIEAARAKLISPPTKKQGPGHKKHLPYRQNAGGKNSNQVLSPVERRQRKNL